MKKKLLKTIVSLAVTTGVIMSTGISLLAEENQYVKYNDSYYGFDVQGIYTDSAGRTQYYSTTCGNYGYKTKIMIGNIEYTMNPENGEFLGHVYTYDNIRASVSAELVGAGVMITYTVTNNGSSAQEIKIGSAADTELSDNDYVPVSIDNGRILMADDRSGRSFYLIPGSGAFDTLWIGHWNDSYSNTFNNSTDKSYNNDSGIAFSWTLNVPANGTVTRRAILSASDTAVKTVSFDANGGSGSMGAMVVVPNTSMPLLANAFSRDGYTFQGWNTDPNATTATYSDGQTVTITDDMTLYAIWQENAPAPQPDPEPAPQPDPEPAPAPAPAGPTPEQIRAQLISNFVERLYIVALDRTYDVVGRDYWVDQLMNQGNSGSYVAKGFFHSQEFLARDLSDEEFVTVLYSVFFDRTPDAEGFANWTNALANGATRDQVIAGFAGSPEWAATCARFEVNI